MRAATPRITPARATRVDTISVPFEVTDARIAVESEPVNPNIEKKKRNKKEAKLYYWFDRLCQMKFIYFL